MAISYLLLTNIVYGSPDGAAVFSPIDLASANHGALLSGGPTAVDLTRADNSVFNSMAGASINSSATNPANSDTTFLMLGSANILNNHRNITTSLNLSAVHMYEEAPSPNNSGSIRGGLSVTLFDGDNVSVVNSSRMSTSGSAGLVTLDFRLLTGSNTLQSTGDTIAGIGTAITLNKQNGFFMANRTINNYGNIHSQFGTAIVENDSISLSVLNVGTIASNAIGTATLGGDQAEEGLMNFFCFAEIAA